MLVKFAAPASGDPPLTGRERFPFLVSVGSRKSGKFMMVPSRLTQYRQHVPERIPLDPFLAPRPLLWSMTFWKNQGRILVRNQMEFHCSPVLSQSFMCRLNVTTFDILEAKVTNLFFPLASEGKESKVGS